MKLEILNVGKKYQDYNVLNSVDITVNEGELVTLFGVSGSGKSTLLKIIAGIEVADSGRIFLNEQNISKLPPQERNIGFIFQKPTLFPHLTVLENISFPMDIRKTSKDEKQSLLQELIGLLKLEGLEKKYPHEISGGQQQRVAFGRALAAKPKILLMDEPFTGLDYDLRNEMGRLVKTIIEKTEIAILFVTHNVDECLKLSDKVAILDKGRIVQFGETNTVYYRPNTKEVATLMGVSNFVKGRVIEGNFISDLGTVSVTDYEEGEYLMFLRPDQLGMAGETEGFWGKIVALEPMGKTYSVNCLVGDTIISLETRLENSLTIGSNCKINLISKILHLLKWGEKHEK